MTSPGSLVTSEKGNALKKESGIPDGFAHVRPVSPGYKPAEDPAFPPGNKDVANYVRSGPAVSRRAYGRAGNRNRLVFR